MRSTHPQANNLLSRLFSYTPREGRLPIEDFCTEAPAWCLLNSFDFRRRFFTLIRRPEWDCDVEVHTQWSYESYEEDDEEGEEEHVEEETKSDAGRFDLLILPKRGNTFAVVIESKVWSKFSDQLSRYRTELCKHYKDKESLIVTLTPDTRKPAESDRHIQWSQIEAELRTSNIDEEKKRYFTDFANFLKEQGIGKMKLTPLTPDALASFEKTLTFLGEFQEIQMSEKEPHHKIQESLCQTELRFPTRSFLVGNVFQRRMGGICLRPRQEGITSMGRNISRRRSPCDRKEIL